MILTHIAAFLGGALLSFVFSYVNFSNKLKKIKAYKAVENTGGTVNKKLEHKKQ